MKLKKFNIFEKREGFDDIDDEYYPEENSNDDGIEEYEYDEEDDSNDDIDHLCYLLRQMFYNSGIEDVSIDNKGIDSLSISVYFKREEKLKDIINVFSIVKKIQIDILGQYESSFELWETKHLEPVITFEFNYFDKPQSFTKYGGDDLPF